VNFLTNWGTSSFSRMAPLYAVSYFVSQSFSQSHHHSGDDTSNFSYIAVL
jgi:hypothetical protein